MVITSVALALSTSPVASQGGFRRSGYGARAEVGPSLALWRPSRPWRRCTFGTSKDVSDKQTFVDADDEDQPAIRWFLDAVARPQVALDHRVFRIENLDVIDLLGLEPRIVRDKRLQFRYGLGEFQDNIGELSKQADMARKVNPVDMSVFQKKVLHYISTLTTSQYGECWKR